MRAGPPLNVAATYARTASLSVKRARAASDAEGTRCIDACDSYNSHEGARSAELLKRRILQCCSAGVVAVTACGPSPTPPPQPANDLVALLRPGPATWFVGPDTQNAGLDFDLANLFAQRHNLVLKVVAANNPGSTLSPGSISARLSPGSMQRPYKVPATTAR